MFVILIAIEFEIELVIIVASVIYMIVISALNSVSVKVCFTLHSAAFSSQVIYIPFAAL